MYLPSIGHGWHDIYYLYAAQGTSSRVGQVFMSGQTFYCRENCSLRQHSYPRKMSHSTQYPMYFIWISLIAFCVCMLVVQLHVMKNSLALLL